MCSYKATFLTCKYFRKYTICVYLKVYNFIQEERKQPWIRCSNLLTPFAAKRGRKRLVGSISTDVSLQDVLYMNIVPFSMSQAKQTRHFALNARRARIACYAGLKSNQEKKKKIVVISRL